MLVDLDPDALLSLWQQGLALSGPARDDTLLAAGSAAPTPPSRTLGQRNAGLAALHWRWFGRDIALCGTCPACATVAEFSADCDAITSPAIDAAAVHRVSALDHCVAFRLPTSSDVAAAATAPAGDADAESFATALLERCVIATHRVAPVTGEPSSVDEGSRAVSPADLPAPVRDAVSARMAALDPAASITFDIACPACATRWSPRLDLGSLVWQKVRVAAERLLLDVDTLARAYGWSEPAVLALHPIRRAAYLQLVPA